MEYKDKSTLNIEKYKENENVLKGKLLLIFKDTALEFIKKFKFTSIIVRFKRGR